MPEELEIDRIKAVTANLKVGTEDDKEFERRIKISKELTKEREIAAKEAQAEASRILAERQLAERREAQQAAAQRNVTPMRQQ